MKYFEARFIPGEITDLSLSDVSKLLKETSMQYIDNLLWSTTGYKPEVYFNMAYTANSILLKYNVKEKNIRAIYQKVNEPVYEDSCVEAFIAFNKDTNYYNLEFNYLGIALVGYGTGKNDRIFVKDHLVEKISSYHSITPPAKPDGLTVWELTLNIPFEVFEYHPIASLNGQAAKVNFYKCGDNLPEPHFLSWNNISHPDPNFHLPEFFGKVTFAN
jgi:hypothetical protein